MEAVEHLLVDAMNVIGARPNGWWRDRDGAVRELIQRLERLADSAGWQQVTVAVDGRMPSRFLQPQGDRLRVLYARRAGRNAADDLIIELLCGAIDSRSAVVVTSDQELGERAKALGADVRGVSWLWGMLDALGNSDPTVGG